MKTNDDLQNMTDQSRQEDERMQYECEQAFLRRRYEEPDIKEEWGKLTARMDTNRVLPNRRKRILRLTALAGAIAAAILTAVFIPLGGLDTNTDDVKIVCTAEPEQPITISEGENEILTRIEGNKLHTEKKGVIFSEQKADYRKARETTPKISIVTIPRGHTYQIVLSDGTEVWMNADSRLHFPTKFTGNKREVKLEGEAYFKVAHDAEHPFTIHTDKVQTEVLGTEFNMRAYTHSPAHVTLVNGSVKIKMNEIDREVVLSPGEDIAYADSTFEITRVDTEYCAQWKDGWLYYDNVFLQDILNDLGRWYNLTIQMDNDPSLMQMRLHFVAAKDDSIDSIIENLNAMGYLNVTKNEKTLTVERKK